MSDFFLNASWLSEKQVKQKLQERECQQQLQAAPSLLWDNHPEEQEEEEDVRGNFSHQEFCINHHHHLHHHHGAGVPAAKPQQQQHDTELQLAGTLLNYKRKVQYAEQESFTLQNKLFS